MGAAQLGTDEHRGGRRRPRRGRRGGVRSRCQSPLGWSMAPCASSTATNWYLRPRCDGTGRRSRPGLFNPGGHRRRRRTSPWCRRRRGISPPPPIRASTSPPGSLVTENIGDHAADDGAVATEVSTLVGSDRGHRARVGGRRPATVAYRSPWASPATSPRVVVPAEHRHRRRRKRRLPRPRTRARARPTVSVAIGLSQGRGPSRWRCDVPAQSLVPPSTPRARPASPPAPRTRSPSPSTRGGDRREPSGDRPVGLATAHPRGSVTSSGVPGGGHALAGARRGGPGTEAWALAVVDLGTRRGHRAHHDPERDAPVAGQPARRASPASPLVIGPSPGPPFGTAPFEVRAEPAGGGRARRRCPARSPGSWSFPPSAPA